ncbi:MAG: DNA-binding protein [Planctomycetota bacterium]|nr:MAG: DNA-binding protein [Planctomycetota bacterium]
MAKKQAAPKKPLTKTQLYTVIAEKTGLQKKQVAAVFDAMTEEIAKSLKPRGPGAFVLPGLLKIVKKRVKAKPARKMPKPGNPDEIITVPAKPAHNVIKVRPLKNLKEMV